MYGDEGPLPESDLDQGKQDVTYLLMSFLVALGRCPQQGYVCHPLGPNNNIPIDVYPLQFISSNCFRLQTRTFFPVMKERVRKLWWKEKKSGSYKAQGMAKSAPVIREGKWASLWIWKENTHCKDVCLTLIASTLILLRGRLGLIVTWVARRKVVVLLNSLPILCRLVTRGSAPIAYYPWVRGRPQIASGLCTKVWRRTSKRLLNFGDGIKDPCILLICHESQEVSIKLLFRDMDLLPHRGCNDVITSGFGVPGSLRHSNEFFCKALSFVFVKIL